MVTIALPAVVEILSKGLSAKVAQQRLADAGQGKELQVKRRGCQRAREESKEEEEEKEDDEETMATKECMRTREEVKQCESAGRSGRQVAGWAVRQDKRQD